MSQYYKVGELDDCFGKWSEFYDCITYGTNLSTKAEEGQGLAKHRQGMWETKDFETAKRDWEKSFNSN